MNALPDTTDRPFWNYLDLLLVLGLSFAGVVLLMGLVGAAAAFNPKLLSREAELALFANLVIYALLYGVFRLVLGARYGRPVFRSLGWVPSSIRAASAIGAGIVLAFAVDIVAALLKTPKVDSPIEKFTKSPGLLIAVAIMAITAAPLFEELFFRGFLQPLLSRSMGPVAGIAVTGLLFGCLHLAEYSKVWQYAAVISIVGFVLGWVRERARSIIPTTIMHAAFNSVSTAALIAKSFHHS